MEPMDAIVVGTTGRVIFSETARCMQKMLRSLPLKGEVWTCSPYWNQALTASVKQALEGNSKYMLFFDGDAVWQERQVVEMYNLIDSDDRVNAICPVQADRNSRKPLVFDWLNDPGKKTNVEYDYSKPVSPIIHGHFGMTFIRSSVFKELPEPWFWDQPNNNGTWELGPGKQDADTYFWTKMHEHNRVKKTGKFNLQANHVVVGHMELVVRWQQAENIITQTPHEYNRDGVPYGLRCPYQDELYKVEEIAKKNLTVAKMAYEKATLATKTALRPLIESMHDVVDELNRLELRDMVQSARDFETPDPPEKVVRRVDEDSLGHLVESTENAADSLSTVRVDGRLPDGDPDSEESKEVIPSGVD